MITHNLCAALRIWAGPARDRLTADDPQTRVPWVIACWEDAVGQISTTLLREATTALRGRRSEMDFDSDQLALPADWLKAASDFTARVRDIVIGKPEYLAGIGLITRTTTTTGQRAMRVQIATASGDAFTFEHGDDGGEARLRCKAGDPLWWDQQAVLEPLERYRAAVTGWLPVLPDNGATPARSDSPSAEA